MTATPPPPPAPAVVEDEPAAALALGLIDVPEAVRVKALKPIQRMLEMSV